jgi:hypothetical protein
MQLTTTLIGAGLLAGGLALQAADSKPLGLTLDLTTANKYMAHGYNFGGNDEFSLQPSLTYDTPVKGLAFTAWFAFPVDRNFDSTDEVDLLLKYSRTLWEKEKYALKFSGYFDYWILPQSSYIYRGRDTDVSGFKLNAGVAMPNLLKSDRISVVPGWAVYHWIPERGGAFNNGSVHDFSLTTQWETRTLWSAEQRQSYTLTTAVDYNDGVFNSRPGWSHQVNSLAVSFGAGPFTITPSINYQVSMEKTVNPENELWGTLSVALKF